MKSMNIKKMFISFIKRLFEHQETRITIVKDLKVVELVNHKTNKKSLLKIYKFINNEWKQTYPRGSYE